MNKSSNAMNKSVKYAYWAFQKKQYVESLACLLPFDIGEQIFSRWQYFQVFGELPNIKSPHRFNEHIKSLMLSRDGRSALRAEISDKELVKNYIERIIGGGYTAKTLGLLYSKRDVLEFDFPENCAIKATHDSGSVVLRKDGRKIDRHAIANWFDRNYYWLAREPNYRNLKPKIIVEELLVEYDNDAPRDYKVFCFSGVPCFVQVDVNRFTEHQQIYFSPRWSVLAFLKGYPRSKYIVPKPDRLREMLEIARRIAVNFSFIRVDFFLLNDRIVIGELTNFPGAGGRRFTPDHADYLAGSLFANPNQDVEQLFGVI